MEAMGRSGSMEQNEWGKRWRGLQDKIELTIDATSNKKLHKLSLNAMRSSVHTKEQHAPPSTIVQAS